MSVCVCVRAYVDLIIVTLSTYKSIVWAERRSFTRSSRLFRVMLHIHMYSRMHSHCVSLCVFAFSAFESTSPSSLQQQHFRASFNLNIINILLSVNGDKFHNFYSCHTVLSSVIRSHSVDQRAGLRNNKGIYHKWYIRFVLMMCVHDACDPCISIDVVLRKKFKEPPPCVCVCLWVGNWIHAAWVCVRVWLFLLSVSFITFCLFSIVFDWMCLASALSWLESVVWCAWFRVRTAFILCCFYSHSLCVMCMCRRRLLLLFRWFLNARKCGNDNYSRTCM